MTFQHFCNATDVAVCVLLGLCATSVRKGAAMATDLNVWPTELGNKTLWLMFMYKYTHHQCSNCLQRQIIFIV